MVTSYPPQILFQVAKDNFGRFFVEVIKEDGTEIATHCLTLEDGLEWAKQQLNLKHKEYHFKDYVS